MAITDAELVAQVLAGDVDAYRQIVERHQQAVAKLIYFKVSNPSDVEDLTQETFLRAFSYLHSYNPEKPLRTWLLSIAVNICRSWKRKQLVTVPLRNLFHLANDDTSSRAIANHHFWELRRLLEGLPQKERDVLVLHYVHELTLGEIGGVLGIPLGTVKSRLNRGLKRMRKGVYVEGREKGGAQVL